MLEFLEDGKHWPNLSCFICDYAEELNQVRPFVVGTNRYNMVSEWGRKNEEITTERFTREWLYSDFTEKF